MNAYPKIGSIWWILVRRRTYFDLVQAKVIDVDWTTGKVTFRWKEMGRDRTVKRRPGHFWKAGKEAEEALVRTFGRRQRWDSLEGLQLKWFGKGD